MIKLNAFTTSNKFFKARKITRVARFDWTLNTWRSISGDISGVASLWSCRAGIEQIEESNNDSSLAVAGLPGSVRGFELALWPWSLQYTNYRFYRHSLRIKNPMKNPQENCEVKLLIIFKFLAYYDILIRNRQNIIT